MKDCNNVFGQVICPDGIESVHKIIKDTYGSQGVEVTLRKNRLRFTNDAFDFESDYLGDNEHLLNGSVDIEIDAIVNFVQDISGLLANAGIKHKFEVYDEKDELYKKIG